MTPFSAWPKSLSLRLALPRWAVRLSIGADQLTTPRRGIDVGDRLRERPAVAAEVFRVVLALTVRKVRRRVEDAGAVRHGPFVVAVRVLHPHEHGVGQRALLTRRITPLDHDERAVAEDELHAVSA